MSQGVAPKAHVGLQQLAGSQNLVLYVGSLLQKRPTKIGLFCGEDLDL